MGRMFRNGRKLGLGIVIVTATVLAFQNCGMSKFNSADGSSSGDEAIDHDLVDHGAELVLLKNSSSVPEGNSLAANSAYVLRALGDGFTPASAEWSAYSGMAGYANCTLTGSDLMSRTLNCSSVGTAHVEVVFGFADGAPALRKTFERQVTEFPSSPPPSNLVTFEIKPGTGNSPWNTQATAVIAFKGQTLVIKNTDTIAHRMHSGGRPCPHQPSDMNPGQSYNCVIASEHSATATDVYDHNVGNSATFFVRAIDGAALYNTTKFNIGGAQKGCVDCHGALANSSIRKASFSLIKAAIAANNGGMAAINLTDDQLRAIEFELSR